MRSPVKYLFDDDFTAGPAAKPSIPLADHARELKEVEAAAYARGFAAAQMQAKTEAEQRTAAALERVAAAVSEIKADLSNIEARLEGEAVAVAVAVAKKLAPALIAREPFAEIAALAVNCFRHLIAAPHVVVRVNDALHAVAREKLEGLLQAQGLQARLVVLAESGIALGDCRIEWADGGITRDRAATEGAIDEAVARYAGARTATDDTPTGTWRRDP